MRTTKLIALLLVCSSPALSGCTALLLGGAAAGGYALGKDERPPGQVVDDGTITASIKTRLLADKYVKGLRLDVDTYNGVVTLHGNVHSYVERTQAEKIARDIIGVKDVVNKINVIEPAEQ